MGLLLNQLPCLSVRQGASHVARERRGQLGNNPLVTMNSTFYCIVGLGNPGKQYYHTRHNIGFRILEFFAQAKNVETSHAELFSFSRKHNIEFAKFQFGDKKLILVKPQTYMNRSGYAVRSVISYYNIPLKALNI